MARARRQAQRKETGVKGARILVVEARFYDDIADLLLRGAKRVLRDAQAEFDIVTVPGALEIPAAIMIALHAATAREEPYDGVVALGCVIRGETSHYDIVAGKSARAIMDISIALDMPMGNGILTVDTDAQARARARAGGEDKGGGAARAALTLVRLKRRLARSARSSAMIAAAPREDRKANRRGAARLAAVQALYQMDIAATPLNDILAEFESHWIGREVEGSQYLPAEAAFFQSVVRGVLDDQRTLDPMIDKALNDGWPLKRIEALLRAVLRAGAFELSSRTDVPARVVVAEYVDVAHAFLDKDETGMVNAVLDQLARQLRAGEFGKAAG